MIISARDGEKRPEMGEKRDETKRNEIVGVRKKTERQ